MKRVLGAVGHTIGKVKVLNISRESSQTSPTHRQLETFKSSFADEDTLIEAGRTYGLVYAEVHEVKLENSEVQAICDCVDRVTAGGATVAQIALYSHASFKQRSIYNKLLGRANVDLASYFEAGQAKMLEDGWHPLTDPANSAAVVGQVRISVRASGLQDLERQLWRRVLPLVDFNGDKHLGLDEFEALMRVIGNDMSHEAISALFAAADKDGDGLVSEEELAEALSSAHRPGELTELMRICPLDGTLLMPGDDFGNVVYVMLCLDKASSKPLQSGFQTPEQAKRSWMLRLSEWGSTPLAGSISPLIYGYRRYYGPGLNVGARAGHILVFDRAAKRVVEEKISGVLLLAMRNLYQSKVGLLMLRGGASRALQEASEHEGHRMDSPESKEEIHMFLKQFEGLIDLNDIAQPLDSFPTFNEFFYRRLRPGSRPVAAPQDPTVAVSAADCRLMAYSSVDQATRFWIKGQNFTIGRLLAEAEPEQPLAHFFTDCSMAIFRLAPQDYHRFHFPVRGTLVSLRDIPGKLYTVNPIAVNSRNVNVFCENKRAVALIDSPDFGRVAFVAIGATMVGSIVFTAEPGQKYDKGDEMGYFAFGGSTTVALFAHNAIEFDADIMTNSFKSLETLVRMGERLGVALTSTLKHSDSQRSRLAEEVLSKTEGIEGMSEAMLGSEAAADESAASELVGQLLQGASTPLDGLPAEVGPLLAAADHHEHPGGSKPSHSP